MAVVADQYDVEVVFGEPPGFVVHLRDQRACGIDGLQLTPLRLGVHRR